MSLENQFRELLACFEDCLAVDEEAEDPLSAKAKGFIRFIRDEYRPQVIRNDIVLPLRDSLADLHLLEPALLERVRKYVAESQLLCQNLAAQAESVSTEDRAISELYLQVVLEIGSIFKF